MIVFREEFIKRYNEKLNHKIMQELDEKLPDTGYFADFMDQANKVLKEIVELNG